MSTPEPPGLSAALSVTVTGVTYQPSWPFGFAGESDDVVTGAMFSNASTDVVADAETPCSSVTVTFAV